MVVEQNQHDANGMGSLRITCVKRFDSGFFGSLSFTNNERHSFHQRIRSNTNDVLSQREGRFQHYFVRRYVTASTELNSAVLQVFSSHSRP